MSLESYAEYTENRLIVEKVLNQSMTYTIKPEDIISSSTSKSIKVELLTSSSGKLKAVSFLHVLVGNNNEMVMMDSGSLILLEDGTYFLVRTGPDSCYKVTPVSKSKNFSVTCIPVNSNP